MNRRTNEQPTQHCQKDLSKLQHTQNCLARVVFKAPFLLFKQLHWLPVICRIKFKLHIALVILNNRHTYLIYHVSQIYLGHFDNPFANICLFLIRNLSIGSAMQLDQQSGINSLLQSYETIATFRKN